MGIRPKLLPCASKSAALVGISECLNRGVRDFKFVHLTFFLDDNGDDDKNDSGGGY